MTSEEIEKTLAKCGDLSEFDCKDCPLKDEPLCFAILRENALDYINRIKAEKEQARKETAKEILHDIYQRLAIDYVDEEIGYQDECIDTACLYEDLKEIAEKYDVEVGK